MRERIIQILSSASPSVLRAVSLQPDTASLQKLSESAAIASDRKTLNHLVATCFEGGYEFARGVATGMLTKEQESKLQLVVSAPFANDSRQTAGVLAELIGSAEHVVCICSYVFKYLDEFVSVFKNARDRGVSVRILLDKEMGKDKSDTSTLVNLRNIIGEDSIRFWASESDEEHSLHAKFLIADKKALITSANMTGRAVTRNIEVGCLIEESDAVERLSNLFELLWSSGMKY